MLVALAVAGAFAYFIWPTPYRYDRLGPTPVRTNRFTGRSEQLTLQGWVAMEEQRKATRPERSLSYDDLERLKLSRCRYREPFGPPEIKCELYNGTDFEIKSITVRVVVQKKGSQKTVLDRLYDVRIPYLGLSPRSVEFVDFRAGFELHKDEEWGITLVGANGAPLDRPRGRSISTLQELESDPDFKALSPEEQFQLRRFFFQRVTSRTPEFRGLPLEERTRIGRRILFGEEPPPWRQFVSGLVQGVQKALGFSAEKEKG